MDYARKIGKPKNDGWSKLRDCVPQKPCDPRKPSTPLREDRRLANWKRWLADREGRQKYLAAALKREPIDLALNAHEKVRAKNESKCLLEAAARTELTNQDKYRGNPAFWRPEVRLKKKRDDDDEDGKDDDDVVVRKDRAERCLPPDVIRVALPAYIKKEKMLIEACTDPSKINLHSNWNCGEYLKRSRAQLNREIKYLEPKQPETDELMIIGRRSSDRREKADFTRIPVITITPEECKPKLLNDPDDRAALSIQKREFVLEGARHFEHLSVDRTQELKQASEDLNGKKYVYAPFDCERVYEILPKSCKPVTWTLHFEANASEIVERKLCMENRGVRVVHVEWRKATTTACSSISLPERLDTRFFFNKSRVSIAPGQRVEMPVWFRSTRPMIATETWQLIVDPKVYPGTMLVRLWAVSSGEEDKLKREKGHESVKVLLKDRARDVAIREIIDELIVIATTESNHEEDVPYELYFLESQLFEARNPGYYYKSPLADELKRMHEDVTQCGEEWNLSLVGLRSSLVKRETPIERREKFVRFQAICRECLLPDFYYSKPRASKERLVYWLLCMFVNRFEDEDDYVMRCCCREVAADDESEEEAAALSEMENGPSEVFISGRHVEIYRQAMFIRIHCLLRETIDKICLAVESCDFFNK